MRFHPVLDAGFSPADLLQRQLAAFVVQFLETIKAIARIAHYFAGFRNAAEHLGQVQQPHFILDDLLISVHDISFLPGPHSLSENVRSSRDYYRLQISGECFARSSEKERSPSIV